jgi:hypothetical protein
MNKQTILLLVLSLFPIIASAQSDVNKMLKDIDGKVDEIVIKSVGKEYRFSGDEAETLFSAMKDDKEVKAFTFTAKDGKVFEGDSSGKKIIIKELGDDSQDSSKQILVFIDEDDFDSDDAEIKTMEKKVIVSGEGDKKVVNVTINEDGKESIEVYEGKAADEYLEKMKSEKEIQVNVDVKEKDGKKVKKIVIEKEVVKE